MLAMAVFALVAADANAIYDPKHGRFLQRDPIGTGDIVVHDQQGGPRIVVAPGVVNPARVGSIPGRAPVSNFIPRDPAVVQPRVSQASLTSNYVDGMNLYQYVKSSPLNGVDPLGLWNESMHFAATKDIGTPIVGEKCAAMIAKADNDTDTGSTMSSPGGDYRYHFDAAPFTGMPMPGARQQAIQIENNRIMLGW